MLKPNMKIHLVTVVGSHLGLHLGIFDQMLRHYKESGIDSILVNVQPEQFGDSFHKAVARIVKSYDGRIVSVFIGKWSQFVNAFLYQHTMAQAPLDWFLLADTDEFQVYPDDVTSVIRAVDEGGFDYINGFVVDRLSHDGTFADVKPDISLWEQYSLGGLITFPLLGANMLKIVAAKGWVRTAPGQHFAYTGKGSPASQCYIPVHHFKWTAGLLDRLRDRVAYLKRTNAGLWQESDRFIQHCDSNGGKIDVNQPSFMLSESGKVCPHEELLKTFALENARRMPFPP